MRGERGCQISGFLVCCHARGLHTLYRSLHHHFAGSIICYRDHHPRVFAGQRICTTGGLRQFGLLGFNEILVDSNGGLQCIDFCGVWSGIFHKDGQGFLHLIDLLSSAKICPCIEAATHYEPITANSGCKVTRRSSASLRAIWAS